MCVVSNVGDYYKDRWTLIEPHSTTITYPTYATKEELELLKKEVLEMKKALKKALKQDIKEGNPDCQMEDKIAILKKVAEIVGVDLSELK